MSVKLRLRRMGRKKLPIWGLVAADSRAPRDGRFIEDLGRYEPVQEPAIVKLNHERIVYWLLQGAQPSDTVRNLLKRDGVLMRAAMTRKGAEAEEIEQAIAELMERQAVRDEKKNAKPTTAQRRQKALESERESAKERAAELAKERAEKEAELERLRKDTEEKERAEKEAQLAAASAEAAGEAAPEGATDAAEADAAAEADGTTVEAVQGDMSDASTGNAAPITDAPPEEAAAEKVADLKAMDASGADVVQAEAQEAVEEAKEEVKEAAPTEEKAEEAPAADAAAETTADDVSEEAPAAAAEQPAAEDDSTEAVADAAGAAVAEQADAGAKEEASAEEAAPKKAKASSKGDKLTDLWGVGPKYAGILTDAGVTSFSDIASKSVEELQAIITEAGSTTAGNEETWARQAELLAAGDKEAFEAYVTEMKNA